MKTKKNNAENSVSIIHAFLKKLNYSIPAQTVENYLDGHPNGDSMLAISDFLTVTEIENMAIQIDFEKLRTIDAEKLIFLQDEKFVIVEEINDNGVTIINQNSVSRFISVNEFQNIWDGIAIVATKKNVSFWDVLKSRVRFRFSIYELASLLVIFLVTGILIKNFAFLSQDLQLIGLLFSKMFGVLISILLLEQTFGKQSSISAKICGLTSNSKDVETGCSKIMKSGMGEITNWLTWAELGFIYFLSTLLYLLFSGISIGNVLQIISIISLCAIPFTIYSVGFQAFKKTYCTLCLLVVATLWCEVLFSWRYLPSSNYSLSSLFSLIYILTIVSISWALFKKLFVGFSALTSLKRKFGKFKYDQEVFKILIDNEKNPSIKDEGQVMVFGNKESRLEISIVSNPYCQPCAEAHMIFENLLQKYPDHFKLNIIMPYSQRENDNRREVVEYFLNHYLLNGKEATQKDIHRWFAASEKSAKLLGEYKIQDSEEFRNLTSYSQEFMEKTGVYFTPAIFIDGKPLPKQYELEDLESLVLLLS